jgi:subtilase family serine protease
MRANAPKEVNMKVRLALFAATVVASLYGSAIASAAIQAPESPMSGTDLTTPACTSPDPVHTYAWYHCYTPSDIRDAYGVSLLGDPSTGTGTLGQGQTIVLVDAYGSPTAANDLQFFHDKFFPNLPKPDFTAVYPQGNPPYSNTQSNGLSGPSAAANWTGEATLDIEWSYAIAPLAHIILIGVPPAETEGVQGLPNLFKAIRSEIAATPAGTVFSMSFGVTEQTFGGAAATQTAKFDAVFRQGIAKGDTFFASSGDNGSTGVSKQHKETATYSYPTDGWPASSPYVTSAGGTQLQYGWTWRPTSDTPFEPDGSLNPDYFNYDTTPGSNLNTVWNESWLPAASGGGPSAIYPRPSWQAGVDPTAGDHRLVPDIAWNAAVNGGVLVYITAYPSYQRSGWHVYGGTSAASPQLAALTALADQQRAAAVPAKAPLGNIDSLIYANPGWFNDVGPVTEGTAASGQLVNNQLWQFNADGSVSPGPVPGWLTTPGYDMTTGLGTPNAPAYVDGLTAAP